MAHQGKTLLKFFEFLANNTQQHGSWEIQFNNNKCLYESAVTAIEKSESNTDVGPWLEFESPAMRQAAIDSDSIYCLCWYQDNAVGSVSFVAPTLESLVSWVMSDPGKLTSYTGC